MPNAEQFMLTLSEHQTIQPDLVRVYMARALVLVVFVSNYVVVLFSFDIVTNVLISPCIFLLIAYISDYRDVVVVLVYGESDYGDVVVGSYMVNQTTEMSW